MAELGMRVGSIEFCVLDHLFNRLVGAIGGCVVDIDGFQLNVERGNIGSVKSNYISSDFVDLALLRRWRLDKLLVRTSFTCGLFGQSQFPIQILLLEQSILYLVFELVQLQQDLFAFSGHGLFGRVDWLLFQAFIRLHF